MIAWGLTHEGMVRATNQDFYIAEVVPEIDTALFVVCDGMGGANAGNIASKFAAESFADEIRRNYKPQISDEEVKAFLFEAVTHANSYVHGLSIKHEEFEGMGTTLVGGIAISDKIYLANVGDSRAYIVSAKKINRLTRDHSLVEELLTLGKITEEQAKNHPSKNLITRAVGVDRQIDIDIYEHNLAQDEILLLCSDGLSGMVDDKIIFDIVNSSNNIREMCEMLIENAKKNGGIDNITAVLFSRNQSISDVK